jgi:phospholipid/cholesterol/gamma-HCH transport system substrate-binding protein
MKDKRINYVVVGSFTLVVLVGLVVSIALLTGRTGATEPYFTVLQSVPGISRGTQVLYQGYPVGQVAQVKPIRRDGRQQYQVDLLVQKGWKIAEDSVVFLTEGFLAAVNVDIHGGAAETFLQPGAEIQSREPTDIFAALTNVTGDVNDLMEDVNVILQENVKPLFDTVAEEIRLVGRRVDSLLSEENVEHARRILVNLDVTSTEVAGLASQLHTTRHTLDVLLTKVDSMVDNSEEAIGQALVDLRYSLDSVARHIDAVNRNLEGTSRNMNEFSRAIRANPALLLRGKAPPDDVDGARR